MTKATVTLDPSHDWHPFELPGGEPEDRLCHSCEICSCHSPAAASRPCDQTPYRPLSASSTQEGPE